MSTSFGALCTDFYINQKLTMKMDLPGDRETILHLLDRIRADQGSMTRFKRYADELALESSRRDGAYRWFAMRQNSIRSGHVNPTSNDEACDLHRLVLRLAPYHLSLSPLDIESQEVLFGFDLEAATNQNQIVYEALFGQGPLASLMDQGDVRPIDVQPVFGISLNRRCDLQAYFEVKTSTGARQVRSGKYRPEPISVILTVRRVGPIDHVDDLVTNFDVLREHAERLANDWLVPDLLTPISRAITSSA